MIHAYLSGDARLRPSAWFWCWLLLAAPLALAQPSVVKDIFPAPHPAVALNGKLYFAAFAAGTGMELYRSDLSGLNMQLVKDLTAGVNGTGPVGLVNANGTLYFSVGSGLYKSDGTATGTVLVKTLGGPPEWLTNVNGTLYFAANSSTSGTELWKSNGTAAGTVLVKDINPGSGSSDPRHLAALNGTVYFAANNGTLGEELWKSNGTAAGTVLVKDIYTGTAPSPYSPYEPVPASSSPKELTAYNGKVYFAATAPVYGTELWRTDGTAAGTVLVKDLLVEPYIPDEPLSGVPRHFRVVNNKLVFVGNASLQGVQRVYASDGTGPGTVDIGGATPAKEYAPAIITSWAVANNVYCYATYSYAAGVESVVNFHGFNGFRSFSQQDDEVSELTPVNGALYFVADDGMSGRELWVNNAGGIEKLAELNPGPGGTNPSGLFSIGNVLYFRSAYGTGTNALWKYNLNTPPPSDLRLNAGGPDHFIQAYEPYRGFYSTTFFRADAYFTGGTTSALPGGIGTVEVQNVLDPTIYLSERAGTFSYAIPAPQGRYRVILHFAELYWGNTKAGGAGSRKFNVDLEGVRKLTEYDIFAKTGGALRAIQETFAVNVSDGTLNIAFLKGSADVPKVSAIEVIPVAPVNQAPVLADIGTRNTVNGTNLSFLARATDPDGNALTYSLHPVSESTPLPGGATINPTTGLFSWTPTSVGSRTVIIRVTDNGNPAFRDEQEVEICVAPRGDFTLANGSTCNAVNNGSGVTGTLTVKNTELGAYYYLKNVDTPDWYFDPKPGTGGDLVFTIDFPANVVLPRGQLFEVEVRGCSRTTSINEFVYLVPPMAAPTAEGKTIISGQKATLVADGALSGGTYRWYAVPTGGTPLFTDSYFVTPALTATTSYYVAAILGDCEGPRRKVTVTVTGSVAGTFRVNAGGNGFPTIDARSFVADAYFSGGTVSGTTALGIAGTADDYLYQTGRHGSSFSYNFPTGNGSYDVVLHFAETYFGNAAPGGIGSRKFHVNMEGARKLTDYDVFAKAGGALRVAQETFRVTVSDGTLNVAFLKGPADNPAIKAIEVLPAGSGLTVNSGGSAFTSSTGKKFSADVYYASGTVSSIASGEITNTGDDGLYRNARVGAAFSYGLPSGNGTFDVTLHFAETYFGSRTTGGVGSRRFNVDVEGVRRLTNYDVFAKAGGAMRAVKETIRVTVSDGVLNLYFSKGLADNPLVSAIEVTPATVAAREAAPEAGAEDWQVTLFPNPVQDKLSVTLPFPAGQVRGTAVTDATGTVHLRNAHSPSGPNGLELRAAGLPKGLYLLRLDTENGHRVVKFVKQ